MSSGEETAIWPWIGVGDDGRVGIAWLEADRKLPGNDPETPASYGWRVVAVATTTGLGCAASTTPAFTAARRGDTHARPHRDHLQQRHRVPGDAH